MSPRISSRLLATQSDQRLLALVKAGHERAFEAVVQRYRRPLLRYCRSLRLSDARAEDVVQQALLQAWLALANGTEVRELRPWLYRVAHNAAVNAMRGPAEVYASLGEPVGARAIAPDESELERRIALRDALGAVAALPLMQRQAIFLSAVDGQSHDEVAYALGVTPGAVRGLLYRARSSLRSAAAAFTPQPLLNWACSAGAGPAAGGAAERLGELSAAGGGAGLVGVLLKGAAVAITAGAVATGAAVVAPLTQRPRRAAARELASARREPAQGGNAGSGEQHAATDAAAPRIAVTGGSGTVHPRTSARRWSGATTTPRHRVGAVQRDGSGATGLSRARDEWVRAGANVTSAGSGAPGGSSESQGTGQGQGGDGQDTRAASQSGGGGGHDGGSRAPGAPEGADGGPSGGNGDGSTGVAEGGDAGAKNEAIASGGGSNDPAGDGGSKGAGNGRGDGAAAKGAGGEGGEGGEGEGGEAGHARG